MVRAIRVSLIGIRLAKTDVKPNLLPVSILSSKFF